MNIVKAHNLACPLDGKRLELREKQLVCESGHAFDIARQGYVNLLPVQHKRSKQPGDSRAMVLARAAFLNSGVYQPIASALAATVGELIDTEQEYCLLDAGCGEGYYFDFIMNQLKSRAGDTRLSFIGLDISKDAITEAAKRNKHISWLVGSNRQPPLAPASVDIIICVFGFQNLAGFNAVLKPGGKVILVDPGVDHLTELRHIIYPEVNTSAPVDLAEFVAAGFSWLQDQPLQFKLAIDQQDQIQNLLLMTPHFYRARQAGRDAAAVLQHLELTVDVVIRVLEKPA